jgi:hypothetical protein
VKQNGLTSRKWNSYQKLTEKGLSLLCIQLSLHLHLTRKNTLFLQVLLCFKNVENELELS